MWYSSYSKLNEETQLEAGNKAVISGGTQGIGAGIALRFALAGATVWIIGRSEQRGNEMVEKLAEATQEGLRRRKQLAQDNAQRDHAFLQADLSNVEEIKRVANQVADRAGRNGVDWLYETQGGPPTGNAPDTPQGIDSAFAVQCLSRYGLAKNLLSRGAIKQGVCMIAAPGLGGKKPIDLNDIECRTTRATFGRNIPRSATRDSAVLDAVIETFAQKYPSLAFTHISPALVGTNAAANSGFSFPFPQLYTLASFFVPSPNQFAEMPFYFHTHKQGQQDLRKGQANLFIPMIGRKALSTNVQDQKHRSDIIAKLDSYGV